jgi:hypothetical protein
MSLNQIKLRAAEYDLVLQRILIARDIWNLEVLPFIEKRLEEIIVEIKYSDVAQVSYGNNTAGNLALYFNLALPGATFRQGSVDNFDRGRQLTFSQNRIGKIEVFINIPWASEQEVIDCLLPEEFLDNEVIDSIVSKFFDILGEWDSVGMHRSKP